METTSREDTIINSATNSSISQIPLSFSTSNIPSSSANESKRPVNLVLKGKEVTFISSVLATMLTRAPPPLINKIPLLDYSSEDRVAALEILTPGNLTKVLINLPSSDLLKIINELKDKQDEILNTALTYALF